MSGLRWILSYGGGVNPHEVSVGWVGDPSNLSLSVDGPIVTVNEIEEGIGGSGVLRATVTDASGRTGAADNQVSIPGPPTPPPPDVSPVTAWQLFDDYDNWMPYSAGFNGFTDDGFFDPEPPTFAEQYEIDTGVAWDGVADLVSEDASYHDVYLLYSATWEVYPLTFVVKARGEVINSISTSESGIATVTSAVYDGDTATVTFEIDFTDANEYFDAGVVVNVDYGSGPVAVRLHIKAIWYVF